MRRGRAAGAGDWPMRSARGIEGSWKLLPWQKRNLPGAPRIHLQPRVFGRGLRIRSKTPNDHVNITERNDESMMQQAVVLQQRGLPQTTNQCFGVAFDPQPAHFKSGCASHGETCEASEALREAWPTDQMSRNRSTRWDTP